MIPICTIGLLIVLSITIILAVKLESISLCILGCIIYIIVLPSFYVFILAPQSNNDQYIRRYNLHRKIYAQGIEEGYKNAHKDMLRKCY